MKNSPEYVFTMTMDGIVITVLATTILEAEKRVKLLFKNTPILDIEIIEIIEADLYNQKYIYTNTLAKL